MYGGYFMASFFHLFTVTSSQLASPAGLGGGFVRGMARVKVGRLILLCSRPIPAFCWYLLQGFSWLLKDDVVIELTLGSSVAPMILKFHIWPEKPWSSNPGDSRRTHSHWSLVKCFRHLYDILLIPDHILSKAQVPKLQLCRQFTDPFKDLFQGVEELRPGIFEMLSLGRQLWYALTRASSSCNDPCDPRGFSQHLLQIFLSNLLHIQPGVTTWPPGWMKLPAPWIAFNHHQTSHFNLCQLQGPWQATNAGEQIKDHDHLWTI